MSETRLPVGQDWSAIHSQDASWRRKIVGDINEAFVVPRYVRLFYDTFGADRGLSVFEIGAGQGDLTRAILAANRGQVGRWVASECFPDGVAWLRRAGLEAIEADAQRLPCRDAEYDVVVEFDVMHHVARPRDMAREMMRVGRGRLLLVESNGLSVFRKLKELTPAHRAAGERSFAPRTWRGFFEGHDGYRLDRFVIFPFLFPFKCPRWALGALVAWNRAVEHIPVLRWQCSSVAITIEYSRGVGVGRAAA